MRGKSQEGKINSQRSHYGIDAQNQTSNLINGNVAQPTTKHQWNLICDTGIY